MILETERLTLAPITVADAPLAYPIFSDPTAMANFDMDPVEDPDAVEAMLASQIEDIAARRGYYWAIRLTSDGSFLGLCDLTDVDRRHHRAEVSFILRRESWGQGYGLEAMRAALGYAATQDIRRLWARTHVGDPRAEQLLIQLGFEQEGYMRGHIDRDGERRDCKLWGLLL